MVTWRGDAVAIEDSVEGTAPLSGAELADRYWQAMHDLTFGLAGRRGNAVVVGPFVLLRFGEPVYAAHSVEWPIEGGLLAGAAGGRWRVRVVDGGAFASIDEFRPSLPRPIYEITHLQVHLLFTRLFLLRLRDRLKPPGTLAPAKSRALAAAVDVALCLAFHRIMSRRFGVGGAISLLAGYHIACWSTSGRTLGGVIMGQRVVAADGRRLLVGQAVLRFVAAPLAWVTRRPIHDEIAGTDVIVQRKEEGATRAAPLTKSI